jgi:hypothetical protein
MNSNDDSKSASFQSGQTAEEIIAILGEKSIGKPFCWIICYEKRPLQGAPQNSREPHLMIFTTKALGKMFIQGRRRYFGPEPLQIVGVDSPATLLHLALANALDSRYSAPPCGLLLNFSYETGQSEKALTPASIANSSEQQIAIDLGFKNPDEHTENQTEKKRKGRSKKEIPASETEIDASPSCPLCGELLYFGGGTFIGFGDEAVENLTQKKRATLEHTAYVCKKCGNRICKSCAMKYRCPQCKNNTFDRFDLAVSPPPAAVKEKRKSAPIPAATVWTFSQTPPVSTSEPEPPTRKTNSLWWWVIGAAVVLVFISIMSFRSEPASNLASTSTPTPSVLVNLVRGDDKWTRTDIRLWNQLETPNRQALSAPEGSKLLIVTFRCSTSKNPLTLLNPDPTLGGNLLTYYRPGGIQDVYVKDEAGIAYPVILIEVFYDGERPDAFYLVAIVPGNQNTDAYRLYFQDLIPVSLNPMMAIYNVTPLGYVPSPTPIIMTDPILGPDPVTLEGGEDFGMEVAFSSKSTYIASGSCDGRVRIWQTNDLKRFIDYQYSESDCVSDIKFSPDESWMAVAFTNLGKVAIFDVASTALLGSLLSPEVDRLEFSPNKQWLVAGHDGNGNGLWNLYNFPERASIEKQPPLNKGEGSFFTCLQFNPFSNLLTYGGGNGGVKLWDLKNGKLTQTFKTDCRAPESMRFSPDGKYLYYSDGDFMNIHVTETGDIYKQVKFAFNANSISAFSPVMEIVVIPRTEPGKTTLEVWNYWNNQLITNLIGHTGPVYSLEFSPNGKMLVSGGNDFISGEVFIWYIGSVLP